MRIRQPTLQGSHEIRPLSLTTASALGLNVKSQRTTMSPRIDNLWYEVPLTEEWMAAYRLVTSGGKAVVAELRIFPAEALPGRPRGEWSGVWRGIHAQVPAH